MLCGKRTSRSHKHSSIRAECIRHTLTPPCLHSEISGLVVMIADNLYAVLCTTITVLGTTAVVSMVASSYVVVECSVTG